MSELITAGNFDGRDEFRELLLEMRNHARDRNDYHEARQISKTLNRPRRFESAYQHAIEEAEKSSVSAPMAMKANGDFAKWFVEWFSNGGWETVIKFIKASIPLFMTPNPQLLQDSGSSLFKASYPTKDDPGGLVQ